MGIMLMPDPTKALKELYRTVKPNGKCCVVIPQHLTHRDIAMRVIKRLRGPEGNYDRPLTLWKEDWESGEYIVSQLENAGFTGVVCEEWLAHLFWRGMDGTKAAVENFSRLYGTSVDFKDGEREVWPKVWEEQLIEECSTPEGLKMTQGINIVWGTKVNSI